MSNFDKLKEALAKKKAALKTAGKTIKPKQGNNRYVLLGAWRENGDAQFWHDFGGHYVKDAAGTLQAVYICANETFGRPCAVCDGLAELQRTVGVVNPEVAELVKNAKANTRYLVSVLEPDGPTPDTPQVLELGKMAFGNLLTVVEEWGEQVFDLAAPQIINIERTGTTTNDTRYTVQATPKKHALKPGTKPVNLDEFVAQESEEMERKALNAVRGLGGPVRPALGKPTDAPRIVNQAKNAATSFIDGSTDIPDSVTMTQATTTAPWQDAGPASPNGKSIDDMLADIGLD